MADSLSGRPDAGTLPEVSSGLVLWRLSAHSQQLWCVVEDFAGELSLRVHDPTTGQTVVAEQHLTVASALEGADVLCELFTTQGWELVDVDPDEAD